jgi:hypothetical protein
VNSHLVGVVRPVAVESEVEGAIYQGFEVVRMCVTGTTHAVFLDAAPFAGRFRRIPQKWVITILLVPRWRRTLIHLLCFSFGEACQRESPQLNLGD